MARTDETLSNDDVLNILSTWNADGMKTALATVVGTWGSSPRPAGSQLAINEKGEIAGSVSGGCIEGAVVKEALQVMEGAASTVLEFGVSDEEAWEVGLACGGTVRVFVEAIES